MRLFKKTAPKAKPQRDPDLRAADAKLAGLNAEKAARLVTLAAKTGEIYPLIEAVEAMAKANDLYTQSTITRDHATIQKALGDTLLKVGRREENHRALTASVAAYRGAITVSSMLGEAQLRRAAKKNLSLALNLLGHDPSASISSNHAA